MIYVAARELPLADIEYEIDTLARNAVDAAAAYREFVRQFGERQHVRCIDQALDRAARRCQRGGRAAVDANATRILDQEIRDADNELRAARIALAGMMGKQSVEQNHLARKNTRSSKETAGYLRQTLAKHSRRPRHPDKAQKLRSTHGLAHQIASKYAEQEALIKASTSFTDEYDNNIRRPEAEDHGW